MKDISAMLDDVGCILDETSNIQDERQGDKYLFENARRLITEKWTCGELFFFRTCMFQTAITANITAAGFHAIYEIIGDLVIRAAIAIALHAAAGYIGGGVVAKHSDKRRGVPYTIDTTPFLSKSLAELENTLPNDSNKRLLEAINRVGEDARRGADAAEGAQNGVSYLVHDRMGKQAANSKRGKERHEKAVRDDAERQRARRDLEKALKRVADDPDVKAGKHGAILDACRRVCKQFTPLTGAKKNGLTYLPLTKADGKPLTPETLARYYRERHGGKRGKK